MKALSGVLVLVFQWKFQSTSFLEHPQTPPYLSFCITWSSERRICSVCWLMEA